MQSVIYVSNSENVFQWLSWKDLSQPNSPALKIRVKDQLDSVPDVGFDFSALRIGEIPCYWDPLVSQQIPGILVYIFQSKINNEVSLKPPSWLSLWLLFMVCLKNKAVLSFAGSTLFAEHCRCAFDSPTPTAEKASTIKLLFIEGT